MFKTKNVKSVLSAISVLLIFSLMFSPLVLTVSAAPVAPGVETTEAATVILTEAPSAIPCNDDIPALDEAALEKKLKEALTAVKKVISIDDKVYTVFNYNYYPSYDEYNTESWYFNWSSSDGRKNINISVLNGKIISYNKYDYSENYYSKYVKLAKITKADAAKKSEAFLKKILGDEFKGYKLYYQNIYFPSDRFNLGYVLTKNGYDFPNFQINIDVDKTTGEILNFCRNTYPYYNTNDGNVNYQNASKVVTQEEALKSYLDNIGIELVYMSNYDWQTKEFKVQPVYRLKGNYNDYISAVSGELISLKDYGYVPGLMQNYSAFTEEASYSMAKSLAAGDSGGVYYSNAELASMKNAKDYITAEKAIEIIAKAFDIDLEELESYQKNTYLYPDYTDQNKYLWNISFYKQSATMYENCYATVDAKKGTIISYSNYSYPTYYYDYNGDGKADNADNYVEPKALYTYAEVKKMVLAKISEICPYDIEKNFELIDYNYNYMPIDPKEAKERETQKEPYYYFYFVRVVNGIKFENNSIYVNFDNTTGKITYYGLSWNDNVKFPKLDKIISPEKALNSIADYCGYNIYYASNGLTDDGKIDAVLIYKFDNYIFVDPFTGKCLDWSLNEVKKPEPAPNYKDLSGHWSEKIVKTLTDNGIYVWCGDKFDPDKDITKGELITYLSPFIFNSYYFAESGSSFFLNPNIYSRSIEGLDKDWDKALTKQEAAKIICEIAGYGELAKHSEIFVYPFADNKCDEKYKGYVAILKAFGLISGDKDGNFNATESLTRAGAAEIVYNIIMTMSK